MSGEKLTGNGEFFELELSRKSNLCIFGFNGCGKTRLACSIASMLNKQGFQVVVFDSVGIWKQISDLPKIRKFQFFYEAKWDKFDFFVSMKHS